MAVTMRIILVAVLVLTAAINPTQAFVRCDFEGGTDWEAVGTDFAGLSFGWSGVGDVYYADITDTLSYWPFKSDNGKKNYNWSLYISGNSAGFSQDMEARVDLAYGTGSYFAMDYSSEYDLVLTAYNASGFLLMQSTGAANYNGHGTGLLNLRVDNPGISYVTIAAVQGNYPVASCWVIDNIESDAPGTVVPEWPCINTMLGLIGLGGALKLRRR